jgi:hypothetical protein
MKMRVFYGEGDKISFTRYELEKLLGEVFQEGFEAGAKSVESMEQLVINPVYAPPAWPWPIQKEIYCETSPLDSLKGGTTNASLETN